jgi:hypothetical protein
VKKARKLVVGALAFAVMLVAAMPAGAEPNGQWTVTSDKHADKGPAGGAAVFEYVNGGFRLSACDFRRDGYSVRAYASYWKQYQNLVRDIDGANNGCAEAPVYAELGMTVYIKVCLHTKANHFCSRWNPVLADPVTW